MGRLSLRRAKRKPVKEKKMTREEKKRLTQAMILQIAEEEGIDPFAAVGLYNAAFNAPFKKKKEKKK